jgi:hypothetical protein
VTRVSVLVTCHDLGPWLGAAVDSVLGGGFDDVEILVVDDGSTDPETLRILERFERPKTTLFRTANRGLPAARNFLLERARGEFVTALDADDLFLPGFLPKGVATLDSDPGLTFVSAWLEAFGSESWSWRPERCDLDALLAEDTVLTAALVRREALVAARGWDEGMPAAGDEDWDLWIRLVAAGHRGTILPEVLFRYRRRAGSMSTHCVEGETHLALQGYLLDKHRGLYASHAAAVLGWKQRELARIDRQNRELERDRSERLLPEVERRRAEVAALEARLERLERIAKLPSLLDEERQKGRELESALDRERGRIALLDAELRRSRAEVDALRASWSWRLTAPLRALGELVGFRGGKR